MPLLSLKITDFRCLAETELTADPHYNLIYGANASGKTSLLEAIAYLGRGKSFRGATPTELTRHGAKEFLLFGKVSNDVTEHLVGVRNSREGLEVRIDGESKPGSAALAEALPLQCIDPEIHELVAGGPEHRRRYLDWMVFHVEHGYLATWRRFRRTLKQRNASLKEGVTAAELAGWDQEFCEMAMAVHEARSRLLEVALGLLADTASQLLQIPVEFEYRRGWARDQSLQQALAAGHERDRQYGSTQAGPHRADLRLMVDEHRAKRLVSRGQQKLLSCGLIIAATEIVQTHLERPLLMLLDDPAAELDNESLERLMSSVMGLGCQVIATALEPDSRIFPQPAALFHVEQGELRDGAHAPSLSS